MRLGKRVQILLLLFFSNNNSWIAVGGQYQSHKGSEPKRLVYPSATTTTKASYNTKGSQVSDVDSKESTANDTDEEQEQEKDERYYFKLSGATSRLLVPIKASKTQKMRKGKDFAVSQVQNFKNTLYAYYQDVFTVKSSS
ncbi:hypothetical protein CCR75_006873 [Bremia lactucae]|uniref:RxLR effector protein n=1 Tax=Bremia lactucae TaxID=4779 RepID=A0A976NZN3_BRELC|nr:hypothetical protein CCR75_006873 [Bremia lactucae]